MAQRLVGVTDQASGAGVADVRVRERTVDAVTACEQYVIPERWRVPSFIGMASSFRTVGRAAVTQHYFSIANQTGTGVLVCVRSIEVHTDYTVVLVVVDGLLALNRPSAVPGAVGTTLTKVSAGTGLDTAQTSDANVIVKGDSSADGTNSGTALTWTAGSHMWRHHVGRVHTAVGQILDQPKEMVPYALRESGIILRANESVGVTGTFVNTTDNPATNHYTVSCLWEEYTLP